MVIPVKTSLGGYNIILQLGALNNINQYFNLKRKVLVVTDSGVPKAYSKKVASLSKDAVLFTFDQGEGSKNIETLQAILKTLVENQFTRSDCIVAVGGGVVGDISGFAASIFMRGIDFYNVPTTLLSQVDSSIGGKTAIDFMGYKNIVGAFYPPQCVVIDPETLETLPKRQISNGLAESLKMALTNDKELFDIFENGNSEKEIDNIICRSLLIKKSVVEADEKESGLRRVLNFGHTVAHAVESVNNLQSLYHGECVAIGMVPMCSAEVKSKLIPILKKLGLPATVPSADIDSVINACLHDKKMSGNDITTVYVNKIGSFEFRTYPFNEFEKIIRNALL